MVGTRKPKWNVSCVDNNITNILTCKLVFYHYKHTISMQTGRQRSKTFKKPQDTRSCSFRPEGDVNGNRRTPKDLSYRVGNVPLTVKKVMSMQIRGKKG
jgi:hypothetical protein